MNTALKSCNENTGENKMDVTTKIIQDYYDTDVENEWNRIANRPEFLLTCRMIDRYIKPGDTVLDIGGGPGRYSLHITKKGCAVTLFDLSAQNTKFAATQATCEGLTLKTITGDAREAHKLVQGQFDHVLLMGPMYHLLEESDRIKSLQAAIQLLKPGGIIYVAFINMYAEMVYLLKNMPESITSEIPSAIEYRESVIARKNFVGDSFTKAFFIQQSEIQPFMSQFSLEKLHIFGQEGVMSPNEASIMSQPQEVIDAWLDFNEKICDREELLSWAEHLMYVGRKI